jgi:hypothetical protein
VAAFRRISLAALFLVSDTLSGRRESMVNEKGFRRSGRDLALGLIAAWEEIFSLE